MISRFVKQEIAQINIRKVIEKKNPTLAKKMPEFLISILNRIIHINEINHFLKKHGEESPKDFVQSAVRTFGKEVKVKGTENIPKNGRVIFAANHPLGGLDGVALTDTVTEFFPEVQFPVNDILLNIPNLRPYFIPINKHGSNSENLQIIENTFAGEKTILYFPAGLCSRKIKEKIVDLEWKKTFVAKARKHHRDIIPVYIDGRNSRLFYFLANLRKFLGIKNNIEMILLPREMCLQKNKTITIIFGKPIPYTSFSTEKTDKQIAEEIKEITYNIPNTINK